MKSVSIMKTEAAVAAVAPESVELPEPWASEPIAVVVPTYNEVDNIPLLAERIFALKLPNLRLIIVDDNSPDGTGDVAENIAAEASAAKPGRMMVVHRKVKDGIGRAHIAGMRAALEQGDRYVVQMDGDLSHPPEFIPEFLGTMLSTRAGLIIGSRYIPSGSLSANWGLHRRMLSRGGSMYVNSILHTRIADTTGGFKLWRADVLEAIDLDTIQSSGFSFQIEMNYRAQRKGFKIVEVPIHFDERFSGSSKISLAIQLEGLRVPLALRFGKGV